MSLFKHKASKVWQCYKSFRFSKKVSSEVSIPCSQIYSITTDFTKMHPETRRASKREGMKEGRDFYTTAMRWLHGSETRVTGLWYSLLNIPSSHSQKVAERLVDRSTIPEVPELHSGTPVGWIDAERKQEVHNNNSSQAFSNQNHSPINMYIQTSKYFVSTKIYTWTTLQK